MPSPASIAEARRIIAGADWQRAVAENGTLNGVPISRVSISAMNSINHQKTAEFYKGALEALGIKAEITDSKTLGKTVRVTGQDDINKLNSEIQAHKTLTAERDATAKQRVATEEARQAELRAKAPEKSGGLPRVIRNDFHERRAAAEARASYEPLKEGKPASGRGRFLGVLGVAALAVGAVLESGGKALASTGNSIDKTVGDGVARVGKEINGALDLTGGMTPPDGTLAQKALDGFNKVTQGSRKVALAETPETRKGPKLPSPPISQ